MTIEHGLDEILRGALRAAVDSVEPAGDGLQQIRRRVDRPRWQLQLRLRLTECAEPIWLIGIQLEPAVPAVYGAVVAAWTALLRWVRRPAAAAGGPARAEARPRRGAAHCSQPLGRLASVLRPALVVAGAVLVVGAGGLGLFQLQQGVTHVNLLNGGQGPSAGAPAARATKGYSGVPGAAVSAPAATPGSPAKHSRRDASPAPASTPDTSTPSAPPSPAATPGLTKHPHGNPKPRGQHGSKPKHAHGQPGNRP